MQTSKDQLAFLQNLTTKPDGKAYTVRLSVWVRWDSSTSKPDTFVDPVQGDTLVKMIAIANGDIIQLALPENPSFLSTTAGG